MENWITYKKDLLNIEGRVNLLPLFNKITDFLNKRFVIHLIYICAAYDTALHRKQGIRRRVVKWIRDCLMDRWQQVALKEMASNCWKFPTGILKNQ